MAAGQDYESFWRLTLHEVDMVLSAVHEGRRRDAERVRALNFELAGLVAVGVNNPKKFPKKLEPLSGGEKKRVGNGFADLKAHLLKMAKTRG